MPYAEANVERYREAHRRAVRHYQDRHRRRGLCVKCPRRAVAETIYCAVHRKYRGLRQRWLPAEDARLRAAWLKQIPTKEIAARLERQKVSVQARGKLLGLPPRDLRGRILRVR